MPPHPPSRSASCTLLHFAKYSHQVHTTNPLFKILDPPLISVVLQSLVEYVSMASKYNCAVIPIYPQIGASLNTTECS